MSAQQPAEVVSLFAGADPRCQILIDALHTVVHERGRGLPIPSILGVLRLLEHTIITEHAE